LLPAIRPIGGMRIHGKNVDHRRRSDPAELGLVPALLLPLAQPTLQGATKPSEGAVLPLLTDAVDEQHPKVKLGRLAAGRRG
jgi:hypothetical protein